MAQGNKLYPLSIAFYLRGKDLQELRGNVNRLNALLLPNGLQPITQEADLLALDATSAICRWPMIRISTS